MYCYSTFLFHYYYYYYCSQTKFVRHIVFALFLIIIIIIYIIIIILIITLFSSASILSSTFLGNRTVDPYETWHKNRSSLKVVHLVFKIFKMAANIKIKKIVKNSKMKRFQWKLIFTGSKTCCTIWRPFWFAMAAILNSKWPPKYKNPPIWTKFGFQVDYDVAGVSKWAGTRYFYPPEIVYSTGRNYWTPQN